MYDLHIKEIAVARYLRGDEVKLIASDLNISNAIVCHWAGEYLIDKRQPPTTSNLDGIVYRVCRICGENKELTMFDRDKSKSLGRTTECKPCKRDIKKTKLNNKRLTRTFGLSDGGYDILFQEQNGCCAICRKPESDFNKKLAVDHCHTTGKIRGLLCMFCNTALGFMKDDVDNLQSAINYLNTSRQ